MTNCSEMLSAINAASRSDRPAVQASPELACRLLSSLYVLSESGALRIPLAAPASVTMLPANSQLAELA
eukprot:1971821-Pleurochrysis_carterae.AAC.2